MSVLVIAQTPGMDAAAYDQIIKSHGLDGSLPAGCTAHHAGPVNGGWRVVAVWNSAGAAAEFGRTTLGPALQAAGFTPTPPEVAPLHTTVC